MAYLLAAKLAKTHPPRWTVEEACRELEGNLQDFVYGAIAKYEKLKRRAEFASTRWGIDHPAGDIE